jgi:hypothetical protein
VRLLLHAISTLPRSELAHRLARIEVGKLTAWATRTDAESFTREDALRHHEVVCAIFDAVDACLPARFPTLAADQELLRQQLDAEAEHLADQLEAVRGACELAITAVWTSVDVPTTVEASTPGRHYLLRRQAELTASEQRRAQATELAERLEREVGGALRESERNITPSKEVALSMALLVERHSAASVGERLARYVERDLRILVHGPWPPYTFVGRPRSVEA